MNAVRIFVLSALIVFLSGSPVLAICGDVNGDGLVTITDAIYGMNYLYNGGPAIVNSAELDNHAGFTANDLDVMANVCPWFECDLSCNASLPPLPTSVDTTCKIIYPKYMWRHVDKFEMRISIRSQAFSRVLVLPLQIRIDGQIPQIDSALFPTPEIASGTTFSGKRIYPDSGYVVLGSFPIGGETIPKRAVIAKIFVTMPPASADRLVEMKFVKLSPVNAPAPDSSITGMISSNATFDPIEPLLQADCCALAGDADNNGFITISDAIVHICYIFGCGGVTPEMYYCLGQLDVNNDGYESISDAVFLINYIFVGGPTPLCPYERP